MGLEFKEAFSSFLHQYFHTNANFWNSVKISGNFKVAVDEYQEDYLFSEVITKTDCCCSSNLLDKLTTPITIRGTGQPQAPIIIKEEPNESNRPTLISDDVTITNSSIITTPNTSSTPTISSSSPSPNNTCVTIIDKTTDCAGSEAQPIETEKTYTAVLSPDPTYTIPPRPSRWYISNCQPQVTDIDGRTIIPSLLVTTAPTVSSSPSKITDMLQITSCEGDEEAAALQTFSSAQEHDHIETEDTVTLQGTTAFTTEAQVADLKIPVGSVGQFVERGTTKVEPINNVKHFTDHIDISSSSVGSVVNGVRFVDQIIPKEELTSDIEDATSNANPPHPLHDSQIHTHPNSFPSTAPQTTLTNAQALKSQLSITEIKHDPHVLPVNPNRQPLNRKTASPSLKVFRKTLNKALRISYQKAMNLGTKNSNFIPIIKSPLIDNQTPEKTTCPPKLNVQSVDQFKKQSNISPESLDLRSTNLSPLLASPDMIKLTVLPTHNEDSTQRLSQRSSLKSPIYPSRYKKMPIQYPVNHSTEQNKKTENQFSSHRTLPKTIDSIDLTDETESFIYNNQRNAKHNSKFRCATCGNYFTRKSSLNEHQKDVHDRRNNKFICCICGKRFTRPQHLKDHMNIHYMCKPHKCITCGHTFFNKISLLRHKRKCYKNPDLQLTYASQVEKTLTAITPLTTACPHNSSSNDSIASNNDRPQAGFVNKETADKYSMKELLPGSSIYMYDEQIDGVRKRAYDKKGKIDGRRMARQLMNIFFKKNELINCSISSSPAAGKTQLNPVLVNSIISYCQVNSTTLKSAIKDAMWSKITSANAKFAKKMKIQQIQQPIQRFK